MEKYTEYFEIIKKIWSNRRYRALITLGFYAVFFIFVISLIREDYRNSLKPNHQQTTVNDEFQIKNDYLATIKINDGIYLFNADTSILTIKDREYKVELNILTPLDNDIHEVPSFPVKFWRFTPEVISNLIRDKESTYTTNYPNGDIKKGYKIPMENIFKNVNSSINVLDGCDYKEGFIVISVRTNNNNLIKTSLNLTNYYHLFEETNEEYKVNIEYK
ncbi:MAG: hypothetical protein RR745_05125 [Bacilli bacterium]